MGYDTASGASGIVGSVDDVVDRAQAEIYDVTERRTSEDYVHIEALLQRHDGRDRRDRRPRAALATGIPTGFAAWTRSPTVCTPGQMIIVAGRPGSGKSTLALDFARSAAVKHHKPTVVFSLEMGKLEIDHAAVLGRGVGAAAQYAFRAHGRSGLAAHGAPSR